MDRKLYIIRNETDPNTSLVLTGITFDQLEIDRPQDFNETRVLVIRMMILGNTIQFDSVNSVDGNQIKYPKDFLLADYQVFNNHLYILNYNQSLMEVFLSTEDGQIFDNMTIVYNLKTYFELSHAVSFEIDQIGGFYEILLSTEDYIYEYQESIQRPGKFNFVQTYDLGYEILGKSAFETNGNYIVIAEEKDLYIFERRFPQAPKIHLTQIESFHIFDSDIIFIFDANDQIIEYYIQKATLSITPQERVGLPRVRFSVSAISEVYGVKV